MGGVVMVTVMTAMLRVALSKYRSRKHQEHGGNQKLLHNRKGINTFHSVL
jgi:hypothetical protein